MFLYFDGACEPNPGGLMTCGWVIYNDHEEVHTGYKTVIIKSETSNNRAEYCGLGLALRWILDNLHLCDNTLFVRGDSQIVIYQMTGKYACRAEHLKKYKKRCEELIKVIKSSGIVVEFEWISREENDRADSMSEKAYTESTGKEFPRRRK